jgi:hypothetical protein
VSHEPILVSQTPTFVSPWQIPVSHPSIPVSCQPIRVSQTPVPVSQQAGLVSQASAFVSQGIFPSSPRAVPASRGGLFVSQRRAGELPPALVVTQAWVGWSRCATDLRREAAGRSHRGARPRQRSCPDGHCTGEGDLRGRSPLPVPPLLRTGEGATSQPCCHSYFVTSPLADAPSLPLQS